MEPLVLRSVSGSSASETILVYRDTAYCSRGPPGMPQARLGVRSSAASAAAEAGFARSTPASPSENSELKLPITSLRGAGQPQEKLRDPQDLRETCLL